MSLLWFVAAVVQPRWGGILAPKGGLDVSEATTTVALLAKTIELSFVTVFITFLGQALSRRSIVRDARGTTLAEMAMRNWVIQPGSLITHGRSVLSSGASFLGVLALVATVAATFYTTASDAMVAPKLRYASWESRKLEGYVRSSYGNTEYIMSQCSGMSYGSEQPMTSEACLGMRFTADSYRYLGNFIDAWIRTSGNGSTPVTDKAQRPAPQLQMSDGVTAKTLWLDGHSGDARAWFERTGRIVDNATLAMPHPGVYAVATAADGGVLQPNELPSAGSFTLKASVVSPYLNVLCANMNAEELEPLVYSTWPDSRSVWAGGDGQPESIPEDWGLDVPSDSDKMNRTVVDDIFRWGPGYGRQPPVFGQYPANYSSIKNSTVPGDSIYMMLKSGLIDDYTLCGFRTAVLANCTTELRGSGEGSFSTSVSCADLNDDLEGEKSQEWRSIQSGSISDLYREGGSYSDNSTFTRIITQLILTSSPERSENNPSLAEAFAVISLPAMTISAEDSPFRESDFWNGDGPVQLDTPGALQSFDVEVQRQEYMSGPTSDWQGIFYVVLAAAALVNLFCLVYLLVHSGLVTDFTEPQNLFALAMNSPPTLKLKGSCGGGPGKKELGVRWQIGYAPRVNHYFFKEGLDAPSIEEAIPGSREESQSITSGDEAGAKFRSLSDGTAWL